MNHHSQSQKYFRYLFAGVALAFLQGCVAVPIPTPPKEKPFNEGQIGFIETNKTTKEDVIARLGSPSVVRKDGAIFLYRANARTAVIHWGYLILTGPEGDSGSEDIWKSFYLLVEFNPDDTVKAAETLSRGKPCSQYVLPSIPTRLNKGIRIFSLTICQYICHDAGK